MNSIQDILNAFREMRRLNGYASIWKYHPMGVARDIDKWLLTALTEFEREMEREVIEITEYAITDMLCNNNLINGITATELAKDTVKKIKVKLHPSK